MSQWVDMSQPHRQASSNPSNAPASTSSFNPTLNTTPSYDPQFPDYPPDSKSSRATPDNGYYSAPVPPPYARYPQQEQQYQGRQPPQPLQPQSFQQQQRGVPFAQTNFPPEQYTQARDFTPERDPPQNYNGDDGYQRQGRRGLRNRNGGGPLHRLMGAVGGGQQNQPSQREYSEGAARGVDMDSGSGRLRRREGGGGRRRGGGLLHSLMNKALK